MLSTVPFTHVSEWRGWDCWLYTAKGSRLLLRGEVRLDDASEWVPAYLVLREPRYVRLPRFFPDTVPLQVALDGPVEELAGSRFPASGAVPSAQKVRISSEGRKCEVSCQSVALYLHPMELPSPLHPAVDYVFRSDAVMGFYHDEPGSSLADYLGGSVAELEWSGVHSSHGQFRLLASGVRGGGAVELRFYGTEYLDLPIRMEQATFRVADTGENAAIRKIVPLHLVKATYPPKWWPHRLQPGECPRPGDIDYRDGTVMRPGEKAGHLIIECREGCFNLLVGGVTLRRLQRRNYACSRYLARPLWEGGPPVSEL